MELRAGLPEVVGDSGRPALPGEEPGAFFFLTHGVLAGCEQNWLEAPAPWNGRGDPPSPSCRAPAWAGALRGGCHHPLARRVEPLPPPLPPRGQGLGAWGWFFPAGSASSFPMERPEEVFMKDMASSQQEQDIHHHVAGGMPWVGQCGQGRARPAAAGGPPCPGWAELPAGNPNLKGLLKSPRFP